MCNPISMCKRRIQKPDRIRIIQKPDHILCLLPVIRNMNRIFANPKQPSDGLLNRKNSRKGRGVKHVCFHRFSLTITGIQLSFDS